MSTTGLFDFALSGATGEGLEEVNVMAAAAATAETILEGVEGDFCFFECLGATGDRCSGIFPVSAAVAAAKPLGRRCGKRGLRRPAPQRLSTASQSGITVSLMTASLTPFCSLLGVETAEEDEVLRKGSRGEISYFRRD